MIDAELVILIGFIFNVVLLLIIFGIGKNIKKLLSFYVHENGIKVNVDVTTVGYKDKDGNDIEMM